VNPLYGLFSIVLNPKTHCVAFSHTHSSMCSTRHGKRPRCRHGNEVINDTLLEFKRECKKPKSPIKEGTVTKLFSVNKCRFVKNLEECYFKEGVPSAPSAELFSFYRITILLFIVSGQE
jgi:hypothetical protein